MPLCNDCRTADTANADDSPATCDRCKQGIDLGTRGPMGTGNGTTPTTNALIIVLVLGVLIGYSLGLLM